jgi:hypothetical protein
MTKTRLHEPVQAAPADDAMARFEQLRSALAQTHTQIPEMLARERTIAHDLGLAEARGENADGLRQQLAATVADREAAARRRHSCVAGILLLETELRSMRVEVERQQQAYAREAVARFLERYRAAVAELQRLWSEGEALARTLRTNVPMAIPARVATSVVDGIARVAPVFDRNGAAPSVEAEAAQLGLRLDRLDAALGRVAVIKRAKHFDEHHYHLARVRGVPHEFNDVYYVVAPFESLLDGLIFEVGTLVDKSLLGEGHLHRLTTGRRFVVPAELAAAAA